MKFHKRFFKHYATSFMYNCRLTFSFYMISRFIKKVPKMVLLRYNITQWTYIIIIINSVSISNKAIYLLYRVHRTGDNGCTNNNKSNTSVSNHQYHHRHDGELIWGWGDIDMNQDEISAIKRMNRQKAWIFCKFNIDSIVTKFSLL